MAVICGLPLVSLVESSFESFYVSSYFLFLSVLRYEPSYAYVKRIVLGTGERCLDT